MEENTSVNPITEYQNMILKGMKINPDIIAYLGNQSVGAIHEVYYLLAIDGMPYTDILKIEKSVSGIADKAAKLAAIERERGIYLKKLHTDNSKLVKMQDDMLANVNAVVQENTQFRDMVQNVFQMTVESQKKSIDGMSESLHSLTEMKNQLERDSKKQIADLQTQLDEKEKQIHSLEMQIKQTKNDESGDSKGDNSKGKGGFHLFGHKKPAENKKDTSDEMNEFLAQYVESREYGEKQVDFLISCMEKGDSLKEIAVWASPCLPPENMARLRQVYKQRGGK